MIRAITSSYRLARAGWVFVRYGVVSVVDTSTAPPIVETIVKVLSFFERRKKPETAAERLSTALTKLGPSYIKLGQFLATRRDIVGDALANDLSSLQDRIPPFGMEKAVRQIEKAFDAKIDTLFEHIDEPIAAASIAQVHKARTIDGRDVAVKVLRPGVLERFNRDLESYFFAAQLVEFFVPATRRLRPADVVKTLARTTQLEMDFRLEAAAISEMADNVKDDEGFRVPDVDWQRTTKSVLCIEWIDGIPMTDEKRLKESGIDTKSLGGRVIQYFLRHAMRDGFFHADMHQGNLFVEPDGTIVAVDFGIMGRLSPDESRFLAEILFGFIQRDYLRAAEVHFEAGYVPKNQSIQTFAQALRAIGEPLQDKTADKIAMSRVLGQLLEYTDVFDMATRTELILLQKTMVIVEGVGRHFDPELNMWEVATPVVKQWMEKNLGAERRIRDVQDSAVQLGRFISTFPSLLTKVEHSLAIADKITADGLRLSEETVQLIAREQAKQSRSSKIAIWIGVIVLVILAIDWLF